MSIRQQLQDQIQAHIELTQQRQNSTRIHIQENMKQFNKEWDTWTTPKKIKRTNPDKP